MNDTKSRHPTAAQLRAAIDSGRSAGKTDAIDPAAAPMETDAEAGGAGPTGHEVRQAFDAEIKDDRPRKPSSINEAMPLKKSSGMTTVQMALACAIVLAAFVAIVAFARTFT